MHVHHSHNSRTSPQGFFSAQAQEFAQQVKMHENVAYNNIIPLIVCVSIPHWCLFLYPYSSKKKKALYHWTMIYSHQLTMKMDMSMETTSTNIPPTHMYCFLGLANNTILLHALQDVCVGVGDALWNSDLYMLVNWTFASVALTHVSCMPVGSMKMRWRSVRHSVPVT